MKHFGKLAAIFCGTAVLVGVAWAQNGYTPGQVFGAQKSAARQTATPVPIYRTPVYTPAPVAPRVSPVPVAAKSPVARSNDSLYNVGKPETKKVENTVKKVENATKPKAAPKVEAAVVSQAKPAAAVEHAAAVVDSVDKTVISRRRTGQKFVALTYDDGPNPAYTPKMIEFLKKNDIPATFFLCGNMVKSHPEIVKRLADNGFELANHSYDHPQLTKLSREGIVKQLQDTHDLIKSASGVDVKLMRPPYGAQNETVRSVCEAMGYKLILWNVDTLDWKKLPVGAIVGTIMKETGDGSIILMHDRLHDGKDTVLEATRQAVEQLRARGYKFVTVGELLSYDAGTGIGVKPAAAPMETLSTGTLTVETPGLPIPLVPVGAGGVTSGVLP